MRKPPSCCFFVGINASNLFYITKKTIFHKSVLFPRLVLAAKIRFYSVELFRSDHPTNPASASIPGLIRRTFKTFFIIRARPHFVRMSPETKTISRSIISKGSHTQRHIIIPSLFWPEQHILCFWLTFVRQTFYTVDNMEFHYSSFRSSNRMLRILNFVRRRWISVEVKFHPGEERTAFFLHG